jgi:tripartite motif-containing protein 56
MSSAKRLRPSPSPSSSSSVAVDVSLLECSICTHPFDEASRVPRLLPTCGHTFCAACLASWVKQKTVRSKHTITCPNDGQESEVKGGDVAALPTNFTILPLIAAARRPPPPLSSAAAGDGESCELCEESHNATHRCLECQQFMCDTWAKGHRRMSGTMSHRVVSLAEWRANPQLPASTAASSNIAHLCKSHGKAAEVFDLDCGLFLCVECVWTHAGHAARIKPVTEAATICRAELDEWAGRVEHWDQRIALTDKACDQRGDEVQAAHGRAKDELLAQEGQVFEC